MSSKLKVGVLVVLMIASSAAFAASANTTANVDRASSANVVTDDVGLIGIQANSSSGVVQQNSTGAVTVDFTRGSASGVNTDSRFEIGDTNNGNESYAFNITNQDAESHSLSLDYTGADTDASANIEFHVYDGSGTSLGTADEEGTSASATLSSGQTVFVVVVVDTHGLDTNTNLSGTLTISI
ncbi:hypothetical protein [Halolamina salifodinae]|uniref:Uncharacterized protein n=1 Tax=Halolamina salifodinae TaxID=1202767 RepID=A0A8T4GUE0_9EURY|nr:hypothetical protein [Halolamina salifodinae]MBP1986010.1 hypothetical protein [Halolamina salifodinae]